MEIKGAERGQSTVEFILTFAFGVSLIFVIFNSALNYTTGYLVHYATFMASRVYLTQDSMLGGESDIMTSVTQGQPSAEDAARQVYNSFGVSLFGVPDSSLRINPVREKMTASEYLTVGAVTVFEQKIDILGKVSGQEKLELVSESFLGKEPTRAACANRTLFAITGQEGGSMSNYDITLFDDGC